MTYFVEIRSTPQRTGPILLVPLQEVDRYRGFRSVYAYDETLAKSIMQQGNLRGLRGAKLYSEELLVDFDTTTPANKFASWLIEQRIGFAMYETGRRGLHFHVPMEPVHATWLPGAQRDLVKPWGADTSIYCTSGLYRLKNTSHEKNPGHIKQLAWRSPGNKLVVQQPSTDITSGFQAFGIMDEERRVQLVSNLLRSSDRGERTKRLYMIVKDCAELHKSLDFVLDLCSNYNRSLADPLPADYVETHVLKTWRGVCQK